VVSSILGHSTTEITKKFYAQFGLDHQEQVSAVMGDAFREKAPK